MPDVVPNQNSDAITGNRIYSDSLDKAWKHTAHQVVIVLEFNRVTLENIENLSQVSSVRSKYLAVSKRALACVKPLSVESIHG